MSYSLEMVEQGKWTVNLQLVLIQKVESDGPGNNDGLGEWSLKHHW